MRVAIIGGGIMGISLAYYLSKQDVDVETYEASPVLGGLAGPITLDDGTKVDRFYHAILSSDNHLRNLCTALGIEDQLRFRETRMGFYYEDQIYSMNNIIEFLRFPPLGWSDRFRLGLTVLYAQMVRDWHKLESISVEDWLIHWSGRNTYEHIWRPMLQAKFDGSFKDTPATYIWSRLVRMTSTRRGASQKEESGHLIGGYETLIRAMAQEIENSGGQIHVASPVNEIIIENGEAHQIRLKEQIKTFDLIISTLQVPIFKHLIPSAPKQYLEFLNQTQYLGIIAPLFVLDRPLTGYWTLNITDSNIPFTGVIETTTYIDPEYVGGHHLVYLPKYTAPSSQWQQKDDDEVKAIWLQYLARMFPDFDRNSVLYSLIHRERFVEPIHSLDSTASIPDIQTPVGNLYLATTAQIYPGLTNGEFVTSHARAVSEIIIDQYSPNKYTAEGTSYGIT